MKPEIKNAVIGGLAGTVVMTLMMMFVAAMLGSMLGGYTMGMIAHIMMGVIIFPIGYVIAYDYLPGSPLIKGLSFGVVLWIAAVVMVMPMAGAGFMMSNIGGMTAVMAALMGHLVYGGLLGALAGGESKAHAV